MKYLKNLGNSYLYILCTIIIGALIITPFNYFYIISDKTTNTLLLIISIISMIIGGFKIGQNGTKKGWIEGLKLSLSIILFFTLISLFILKYNYKLNNIIYYIILIISSMTGSIIGANKKKPN